MTAYRNVRGIENPVERNGGPVWNKLHSEREDVCEALLNEGAPKYTVEADLEMADQSVTESEDWHKNLLQARLRKIDDALDRLMSGAYGECCHCGRWIQDTKLDFDPAVAFCIDCWERMQTNH